MKSDECIDDVRISEIYSLRIYTGEKCDLK